MCHVSVSIAWGPEAPRDPHPIAAYPPALHRVHPTRKGQPGVSSQDLWDGPPSRTVLNPRLPQIVFDECHKAKNASSTKMGKAVLDLQNKLPLARVVYASATGEGMWGARVMAGL